MTPKEKAEQLVEKFIYRTKDYVEIEDAKDCAIIAVDEILNAHLFDLDEKQYWQQVKIVIEML
jgi:hypothetical protein